MPRDGVVDGLNRPTQWPASANRSRAAIAEHLQNIETGPSAAQEASIRQHHVHSALTLGIQGGRHRWGRCFLESERIQLLGRIMSLDPSEATTSEGSMAIPQNKRSKDCCHDASPRVERRAQRSERFLCSGFLCN